jgi:hypothetical protein
MVSLNRRESKRSFAKDFKPTFPFKARCNFIKITICFPGAEPDSCLIRTLTLDPLSKHTQQQQLLMGKENKLYHQQTSRKSYIAFCNLCDKVCLGKYQCSCNNTKTGKY